MKKYLIILMIFSLAGCVSQNSNQIDSPYLKMAERFCDNDGVIEVNLCDNQAQVVSENLGGGSYTYTLTEVSSIMSGSCDTSNSESCEDYFSNLGCELKKVC